jgi:serine/threonine protein kinase
MMNHSSKNQYKVKPGTVIEGKWYKKRYTIIKELGFGANGIVYLAKYNHVHVALKMSDNGMSITSEVNVLKSFAKVQGSALGPSLFDVDDWEISGGQISFYVMEYIKGPDFLGFIGQKGYSWIPILVLQLLTDLEKLHQNGWVFGDLKPENLIVTGPPSRIRCIDVGGTTMKGRAIKEFTEFYDRGYWGLGSRKADPGYDLFAVAMIIINSVYPKRFNKTQGGIVQLRSQISQSKPLQKLESVILRALEGNYQSAGEMRLDLLQAINKPSNHTKPTSSRQTRQSRQSNHSTKPNQTNSRQGKHRQQKGKKSGSFETIIILVIVFVFYAFYIFGELI